MVSSSKEHLLRVMLPLEELPTLPTVLDELLHAIDSEQSGAKDVKRIIESDQAMTARVLRVANSAFYGVRGRIDSIQRAVVTLGFNLVRELALATAVVDALDIRGQIVFYNESFWRHCLGAAHAAHLLARQLPAVQRPESCFSAGLLHDVGKYVFALCLKSRYSDIVNRAEAAGEALRFEELRQLGIDHADAGAWVLERWGFPDLLVAALRSQYEPSRFEGPHQIEIKITSLASDLARAAGLGDAGDADTLDLSPSRWEAVGVPSEAVQTVLDSLSSWDGEARLALGLPQTGPR